MEYDWVRVGAGDYAPVAPFWMAMFSSQRHVCFRSLATQPLCPSLSLLRSQQPVPLPPMIPSMPSLGLMHGDKMYCPRPCPDHRRAVDGVYGISLAPPLPPPPPPVPPGSHFYHDHQADHSHYHPPHSVGLTGPSFYTRPTLPLSSAQRSPSLCMIAMDPVVLVRWKLRPAQRWRARGRGRGVRESFKFAICSAGYPMVH